MNMKHHITFPKRSYLIALLSGLALMLLVGLPLGVAADKGDPGKLREQFVLSPALTEEDKVVCNHDFSGAEATIKVREHRGATSIKIKVDGAVPNEFYTAWLKVGGSPLTGIGATPLAPTTMLDYLASADGMTRVPNGFFTDEDGDGKLKVTLDFPLSEGIYPFPDGDVAIGDTPFTIRLASHCIDHSGHGLVPGVHERNFDVSLDLSQLAGKHDEED